MSTLDEQESWLIRIDEKEKAVLEVAGSWVATLRLLGYIAIIAGTIYLCLNSRGNLIVAVLAGFVLCSLVASVIQLFLLGFPVGLVVGAPCGALLGVLLTEFRSHLERLPKWWPSEWLWGAAFGAVGGLVLVGGFAGWTIVDTVGWWPWSLYKRAFEKFRHFVGRRLRSARLGSVWESSRTVPDDERAEDETLSID